MNTIEWVSEEDFDKIIDNYTSSRWYEKAHSAYEGYSPRELTIFTQEGTHTIKIVHTDLLKALL